MNETVEYKQFLATKKTPQIETIILKEGVALKEKFKKESFLMFNNFL